MRIAVIGAGAIGSLYGGALAEHGHRVLLVSTNAAHMDAVREHGLCIREGENTRRIRGIEARTDASAAASADLVLVTVKSMHTEEAMRQNRNLVGNETLVLTLQNGLGNPEALARVIDRGRILAGTSANGAYLAEPGTVVHAGRGGTVIGETEGEITERIRTLAAQLKLLGLGPVTVSGRIRGIIWDKLLVSAGINALSALTRRRNGELLEDPGLVRLMENLVREAESVARAAGIWLSHADGVEHCKEVARATAENRSSMLQDVLRDRETEIDSINGAIVREGIKRGVPTPINETVTALIHGLTRSQQGEKA